VIFDRFSWSMWDILAFTVYILGVRIVLFLSGKVLFGWGWMAGGGASVTMICTLLSVSDGRRRLLCGVTGLHMMYNCVRNDVGCDGHSVVVIEIVLVTSKIRRCIKKF
jgi:hypothetical protein